MEPCYLDSSDRGRADEALKVARNLALNGSPAEQVWAEAAVCDLLTFAGDSQNAARACRRALTLNPNSTISATNLAPAEVLAGHDGAALAAQRLTVRLFRAGAPEMDDRLRLSAQTGNEAVLSVDARRLSDQRFR